MTVDVHEILAELNADVFAELRRLNIKGVRGSACYCPIAVYLSTRRVKIIHVSPIQIAWWEGESITGVPFPADTHPAIISFVRRFDSGRLPEFEGDAP